MFLRARENASRLYSLVACNVFQSATIQWKGLLFVGGMLLRNVPHRRPVLPKLWAEILRLELEPPPGPVPRLENLRDEPRQEQKLKLRCKVQQAVLY